jgi:hypothetical protein
MNRISHIGRLSLAVGAGLALILLLLSGIAPAASAAEFALFGQAAAAALVDLQVGAIAPELVDVDATYAVNVSYTNQGWVPSPDNWVRVTLPAGTQFVEATYAGGEPRPPDEIDESRLTWHLPLLVANSAWGHIIVEVKTDKNLAEGTTLDVLAEIGGSEPDSEPENNAITVTSTVQDMGGAMKRVHVRQTMPADVLEYTITVDLPGQGGGKQWVTLTDTLPVSSQVRFLGWMGTLSGTLIEGHRLRWQGEVEPGDPVQLRYRLGVEGDVPPGAIISNVATLSWQERQMQLGPVATVVMVPHGVMGVGPGQGGLLHSAGYSLTIPPGAVTDTTRFQLGPLFTDTRPIAPPGGLLFANHALEINAYRFGDPVGTFSAPLTITMHYTDTDIAGLKRETLRLWTRTGPEDPWTVHGAPAFVTPGTMAFTTTHLSEFALFGEAKYHIHLPLVAKQASPP